MHRVFVLILALARAPLPRTAAIASNPSTLAGRPITAKDNFKSYFTKDQRDGISEEDLFHRRGKEGEETGEEYERGSRDAYR